MAWRFPPEQGYGHTGYAPSRRLMPLPYPRLTSAAGMLMGVEAGAIIEHRRFAVKRNLAQTWRTNKAPSACERAWRFDSIFRFAFPYSFPFTPSGKSVASFRSVSSVGTPFGVHPRRL